MLAKPRQTTELTKLETFGFKAFRHPALLICSRGVLLVSSWESGCHAKCFVKHALGDTQCD